MSIHVPDRISDEAGVGSPAPADVSAAEADPDRGGSAAVQGRTVAQLEPREAPALQQRPSFARFKHHAGAVLSTYFGTVLDGLLGGAPAGVYAAFAERTIREEDAAAAGQRPARASDDR